jgi:hypothetical protein
MMIICFPLAHDEMWERQKETAGKEDEEEEVEKGDPCRSNIVMFVLSS